LLRSLRHVKVFRSEGTTSQDIAAAGGLAVNDGPGSSETILGATPPEAGILLLNSWCGVAGNKKRLAKGSIKMQTSNLSRKGQVTIPGEIRRAMGLGAGDLLAS